ncbi:magnesium citrate secondary transporter [Litoribacter ruber]|uniref:Magnesium citrate secondary transporter n=1 Tax=Litoribacter ruber TaxID=702568 RepID=A0AAP2CGS3_9BACT|nr:MULTISPECIES: magnesium citrate secondary transporter [Litoribacter]MBS9524373.1 magnesium citrate secondary transporter [Litoribacter alkaliphilus]MBT0809827.1 magnesium citrate secondary transporter [Litoribacter ruber]
MSVFKNPFFIVCCILFWVNQYLEKVQGIFIPYVHAYLDDLLAMPVVLGLTLQAFRWFHSLKAKFVFTKTQIAVAVLYFSLIFEVILPMRSEVYTRDWWDVLMYAIGAVGFYFWINRGNKEIKDPIH